ncbi:protein of unknown function [Kyrpidia spormannii]|uniref:Uncharacterized protein n=1 Tax=Kyrpidia spormannii TaxID=2055160 RepID=A0A6F9E2B3_9BACL|nr:protein of unknown function [Kyrpidia spormannii]
MSKTRYVYRQTITDPYTGTQKEIKSETPWELALKIQT